MKEIIFSKSKEHSGWYITEADGDFSGIKFDSLADAKLFIIRRHNTEQYIRITIGE